MYLSAKIYYLCEGCKSIWFHAIKKIRRNTWRIRHGFLLKIISRMCCVSVVFFVAMLEKV